MGKVHIVLAYDYYDTPPRPVAAFTDRVRADACLAECVALARALRLRIERNYATGKREAMPDAECDPGADASSPADYDVMEVELR